MAKLVTQVKVVTALGSGAASEAEVVRIERDDFAVPKIVGLRLNEGKQLAAAIQAEIVRAQAAILGERFRCCEHSGAKRWSKDCYPATFHSAFRNVPVKIRRLSASRCRSGSQEAKSFAAMMAAGGIGSKLAHEDAARRLRRWPIAILDRGCAQRAARSGRGKETAPVSRTKKHHQLHRLRNERGPFWTPIGSLLRAD